MMPRCFLEEPTDWELLLHRLRHVQGHVQVWRSDQHEAELGGGFSSSLDLNRWENLDLVTFDRLCQNAGRLVWNRNKPGEHHCYCPLVLQWSCADLKDFSPSDWFADVIPSCLCCAGLGVPAEDLLPSCCAAGHRWATDKHRCSHMPLLDDDQHSICRYVTGPHHQAHHLSSAALQAEIAFVEVLEGAQKISLTLKFQLKVNTSTLRVLLYSYDQEVFWTQWVTSGCPSSLGVADERVFVCQCCTEAVLPQLRHREPV